MQYALFFIHADVQRWESLTPDERNQVHSECGAWHEEIVKGGHAVSAYALQPPSTSSTVRDDGGLVTILDGPFAETKEVIGGFEIIECADKEEAIAIAKRFPAIRAGAVVEVRPIMDGPCGG